MPITWSPARSSWVELVGATLATRWTSALVVSRTILPLAVILSGTDRLPAADADAVDSRAQARAPRRPS
jgi:hypothetical protein